MSARSASGSEVRELAAGTACVALTYRVVAKRRDPAPARLEQLTAAEPMPRPQGVPTLPTGTVQAPGRDVRRGR